MSKILVLSEIFPPRIGGSGSWLWDIYSRFASDQVCLVVGRHSGDIEFDEQHDIDSTRVDMTSNSWSVMEVSGQSYYLRMIKKVIGYARSQNADVIHCARVMPEGVVAVVVKKMIGTPFYAFVHGEDIELARASRESRWLVQRVMNAASVLVCNSLNTRQLLLDHWAVDDSKIVCLYPGVDTDRFCPPINHNALREELDLENRMVILTVSRLEKRKGHDKMLDALPAIVASHPNLLYVIVGDGVEMDFLVKKTTNLGLSEHVRFVGRSTQDVMLKYYQSCDLFVLPNRQVDTSIEGFGIVLLEAQACGRPVLAGASGGTSETMVVGKTGVIVDCTASENLAISVLELLSDRDKLAAMGGAARELMVSNYSWHHRIEIAGTALS